MINRCPNCKQLILFNRRGTVIITHDMVLAELNIHHKPLGERKLQALLVGSYSGNTSKWLRSLLAELTYLGRIKLVPSNRGFGYISLEKESFVPPDYTVLADVPGRKDYSIDTDTRERAVVLAEKFVQGNKWENVRVRYRTQVFLASALELLP